MADSRRKCLARRRANAYIQELVKFVFRHHNIELNTLGSTALRKRLVFNEDVGKIVVAYAKSELKPYIIEHRLEVAGIRSHHQYEEYWSNHRNNFIFGESVTEDAIFDYFAISTENSILFYKQGFKDAPVKVVHEMARGLADISDGRFVMAGGLEDLNAVATLYLKCEPSLLEAYEKETFAS